MNNGDDVRIEVAQAATDEVRLLIGELEAVLAAVYPPEQRHGLSLDAIFQPHVRFFLARLHGAAVGCGGVALFPDYAEVKRMYVRDTARGQGIADAILAHIEQEVRSAGLSVLRLETGVRQVAAMRLYARAGFCECPAFGDYALMAPQSTATSVFFEKRVSTPALSAGM
jgi:putative acetyltransferase